VHDARLRHSADEKKAMIEALHREHALSDMFVVYLLGRTIRYEEDLSISCSIPAK
jgi:hypothetical protein